MAAFVKSVHAHPHTRKHDCIPGPHLLPPLGLPDPPLPTVAPWGSLSPLDQATQTCDQLALLLHWTPALLLWSAGPDDNADPTAPRTSVPNRDLRDRLALAETGQWAQLVQQLLLAIEARTAHLSSQPPAPQAQSKDRTYQQVCAKVRGDCLRSAAQLLLSDGAAIPSPATTAATAKLFLCEPLPLEKAAPLQALQTKLLQSSAGAQIAGRIKDKSVQHRLSQCLRAAAQPGPSGTRNTHLKSLLHVPGGVSAAADWCRLWAAAIIPPGVAKHFLHGWCAPLLKPNGSIRPILLFEAALKLATGVVLDLVQPAIRQVVTPEQFGIALPAGAETMLKTAQALAVAQPNHLFVSTDVSNAFGNCDRMHCLRSVMAKVPSLGPILAQQWAAGPTTVWIHEGAGKWACFEVHNGLFQGECTRTGAFCLSMHECTAMFRRSLGRHAGGVILLGYVDDYCFNALPDLARMAWPLWVKALASAGLPVNESKCKIWLPSGTPLPAELLASLPPLSPEGLELMGGAAEDEFGHQLGPFALHSAPVAKRMAKATKLQAAICDMARTPLPTASRQPIFVLVSRLLSHKLDYDARVSSHLDIQVHAQHLDNLVQQALETLMGRTLDNRQMQQVQLPLELGGLGITKCQDLCTYAPLASAIQTHPTVKAWFAKHGLSDPILSGALSLQQARNSITALHELGLHVNIEGAPFITGQLGVPPPHPTCFEPPVCRIPLDLLALPSKGIARVQGRTMKAVQAIQYARLLLYSSRQDLPRLRSAAGPGNGAWLTTFLHEDPLTDQEFLTGISWRLGVPVTQGATQCLHVSAAPARVCNAAMDPFGYHAVTCALGGCRMHTHNSVVLALCRILRDAHYKPAREVHVAAWARIKPGPNGGVPITEEAVMDIVATAPGAPTLFIDATVRHPQQSGQYAASTSVDGLACNMAEAEKIKRYPARGGLHVQPAAVETWGRIGKHLHNLLGDLQAHCGLISDLSATSSSRGMHRWHALLGTALVRSVHHAVSTAMERHEGSPVTGAGAHTHTHTPTPSGAGTEPPRSTTAAAVAPGVSPAAPRTLAALFPLGQTTLSRSLTGVTATTPGSSQPTGSRQ